MTKAQYKTLHQYCRRFLCAEYDRPGWNWYFDTKLKCFFFKIKIGSEPIRIQWTSYFSHNGQEITILHPVYLDFQYMCIQSELIQC